jgi:hypothetical protein
VQVDSRGLSSEKGRGLRISKPHAGFGFPIAMPGVTPLPNPLLGQGEGTQHGLPCSYQKFECGGRFQSGVRSDFSLDPSFCASSVVAFFEVGSESLHHVADGFHLSLPSHVRASAGISLRALAP